MSIVETTPGECLQVQSLITSDGELELSLNVVDIPEPNERQVVIRVEAAPINPSDILLLLGPADPTTLVTSGPAELPVTRGRIAKEAMPMAAARLGQPLPLGNEGAGVVVKAGSSSTAQALLGQTVAVLAGAMFSEYRVVDAESCLLLPAGTTAAEGAAAFVNPLTALSMVETMRQEGHKALVHTAAASSLGQMLNRICLHDGIGLVNIVRSVEQVMVLTAAGATHICNSSAPTFQRDLEEALAATGATLGFDATGGGPLAGQILGAMERVASRSSKTYSRYGSSVRKQVYIYGRLQPGPTVLEGWFGLAWGLGGFLLDPGMSRFGKDTAQALRQRVARELKTTFATRYAESVSLAQALHADVIARYTKRATGSKFLITPNSKSQ
jgi:NADPH:quinone reductase-like Zn-dependent oxidoreductase